MARGNDLSAVKVANLLKAGTTGRYRASKNLYLQVRGKDTGSWLFRYMRDGKAHWMGLGRYPRITLAEARWRISASVISGGLIASRSSCCCSPSPKGKSRSAASGCAASAQPTRSPWCLSGWVCLERQLLADCCCSAGCVAPRQ